MHCEIKVIHYIYMENPREYTVDQKRRVIADWNNIAGEDGEVIFGNGYITYLGSEVATLRLFKAYSKQIDSIFQGWSINLNRYYFTLES